MKAFGLKREGVLGRIKLDLGVAVWQMAINLKWRYIWGKYLTIYIINSYIYYYIFYSFSPSF